MRSLKDIMLELGFKKDAPIETQKAFIRHLIASANSQQSVSQLKQRENVKTETIRAPSEACETNIKNQNKVGEQMSFDLGDKQLVS